ncbi:hypothetical protein Rhe02_02560 [Rhizocola hellebori]|uniref:Secreted protein n=1 Tax=Rhizocola hellebori TaxID=1392758 RepID=A0A8J3Q217_9ACTN|nr:hypothetical protein [Rhizocola hellebori]GIH02189.1 hypothetical protein Rhe02_02560 [Rhizocola hellebori]
MRIKWVRALALTAAATMVLVGTTVAPAQAGPPTAFERCRDGLAPNQQHNVSIVGTQSSVVVGSPDQFWAGDVFRIQASGTIHTSALIWDSYQPDGRTGDRAPVGDPAWPGPNLKKFSLVGAFGPDRGNMQFGNFVFCVQVPSNRATTYLRMWINDDVTSDNSGQWNISVDHYWV